MPSIDATDELYSPEFADTWKRHYLHDLATWVNGMAFRDTNFSATGVPVVKIAEVKAGVTGQTRFTSGQYDSKYRLDDGDLLFCWSGQPETSIDTFIWSRGPGWLNQHIFKVEPDEALVERSYFYYLMRYLRPTFVRIARNKQTTGLGHVTKGDLRTIAVALPPVAHQKAIASTLRAIDEVIVSKRRAITLLDDLFHAYWQRLYDEKCEGAVSLAEVVTTQYGLTASAGADPSGVKFLRVTDINKSNWISWGSVPTVSNEDAGSGKYNLRLGDLVVARMADPGKSALYDSEGVPAVFASYLVRLQPRSYEEGLFVFGYLKSKHYLDYAIGAMGGSVQKNMNARVIVGTRLRWPSASDLAKFASTAKPIRTSLNALLREIGRLEELRDALLPELISGRLDLAGVEDSA